MSATDDTEILPADDSGHAPAPNCRASHGAFPAPVARPERGRPAARTPAQVSPRFLTALLRALSVWPT
jgi:hypothetical protein